MFVLVTGQWEAAEPALGTGISDLKILFDFMGILTVIYLLQKQLWLTYSWDSIKRDQAFCRTDIVIWWYGCIFLPGRLWANIKKTQLPFNPYTLYCLNPNWTSCLQAILLSIFKMNKKSEVRVNCYYSCPDSSPLFIRCWIQYSSIFSLHWSYITRNVDILIPSHKPATSSFITVWNTVPECCV